MKHVMMLCALVALTIASAGATMPGGIAGRVVDLKTGHAFPNAAVAIYRLPVREGATATSSVTSDKQGYFHDITLVPGRYLVTAEVMGLTSSCVIDDVFGGQTTRMTIEIGADGQRCIGPRVHSAVIDPGNTADEYLIR